MDTLKIMGAVAGIGGLALGVVLILFRSFLQKILIPQLGKTQAYRLLRLFLILVWSIGLAGIGAWVATEFHLRLPIVANLENCLPKGAGADIEFSATCLNITPQQQKILARANAKALADRLDRLAETQFVIFLPAMRSYLQEPSEARWKTVLLEVSRIKMQIDSATNSIIRLDPATRESMKDEIGALVEVLQTRSTMLFELPEAPMMPDAAVTWTKKYQALIFRLSEILQAIDAKLTTNS